MKNTYSSTEKKEKKRKKTDRWAKPLWSQYEIKYFTFFLKTFLHFYKCKDLVAIILIIINNYKTWKYEANYIFEGIYNPNSGNVGMFF